jgi:hypothetical protein
VEVDITDAAGKSVRVLHGSGKRGLNRLTWDLRLEPPVKDEREAPGVGGFGGAPTGPEVLPGKYGVTLKVPGSGSPSAGEINVEGDPRTPFSDADRRTRQDSLLALYDLEQALGAARSSARALTAQLAAIKRDLAPASDDRRGAPGGGSSTALEKVASAASQVQGDVERQLNGASQLARAIEGYSGVPTEDQRRGVDWAYEDATAAIKTLNRLLETDAPALYTALTQQQAWPKHLPPIAVPARRSSGQ